MKVDTGQLLDACYLSCLYAIKITITQVIISRVGLNVLLTNKKKIFCNEVFINIHWRMDRAYNETKKAEFCVWIHPNSFQYIKPNYSSQMERVCLPSQGRKVKKKLRWWWIPEFLFSFQISWNHFPRHQKIDYFHHFLLTFTF